MIFEYVSLFLSLAIALNAFLNSFFLHKVRNIEENISQSVVVLLPMRNEENNVTLLIETLKLQKGFTNIMYCIIDDNSTDSTYINAKRAIDSDSRFTLLQGNALPQEWLGKPYALQQGFLSTNSDIVLLLDADVRLEPHALASAIDLMRKRKLDFLSCYPRQIAITFSERLMQPLLQWSWISTVPLKISESSSRPSLAVANGQFLIIRREALEKIDGFHSVKHEVLDDIFLARALVRNGYRGTVVDGSDVAHCRMYLSWREIQSGYGKSLKRACGGALGSIIAIAFLFLTGIAPFIQLLTGSIIGAFSFAAVFLSRMISAYATQGRKLDAIFHPLSSALLIYLIIYSSVRHKEITWKGRSL